MFSDRYVKVFSYGKLEVLVTGTQYGVNSGIGKFYVCGLVTGYDVDSDWITLRIEK